MLSSLFNSVKLLWSAPEAAASFGFKPIKYFIDSHFRESVTPVPGSVVYSDLRFAVEHSGIYTGEREIVNIEVTGFAESYVRRTGPAAFTDKSKLGRKIYVSCDRNGAVGHDAVANGANDHIGEYSFYGFVFKNCHQFSSKCVGYAQRKNSWVDHIPTPTNFIGDVTEPEWEPTIRQLKADARAHLGATKWRLWDWNNQAKNEPEPDWQAQNDFFMQQALTPEFIQYLRDELAQTHDYQQEISDENIPKKILDNLAEFSDSLQKVSDAYEKVKNLLQACPGIQLSYNDIKNSNIDFTALAQELENNQNIQTLVYKMGRAYVAEEVKKRQRVPQASHDEIHGTHLSGDLMRLLPNELVLLEDEDLETLFYARLLERNLQTYQLKGVHWSEEEYSDNRQQRTGPIIACLDTSGSMKGSPLLKARAMLFAMATMLKRENRSLHVLLFGSSGQMLEYTLTDTENLGGLLPFLQQSFDGGTDFDTPMRQALEIICKQKNFQKADILMVSDGDCSLSNEMQEYLNKQKQTLNCRVYSVLCDGRRTKDNFSDEVLVL